ncbi:RHS repeat-associated core domain-containing protein [Mitsuaria sp. GD03876]|uniref:RHS repeat domain-containing protein n=1 Tax=Mitsuaria sp. GD03876 TaxID=2975399 RepID=UPI0024493746|nr:RHS repeat-associated core domain-containing protein [Mitsuaria sp. GD03876]MDH0863144.1 hypothetical protein [Mitsuaria sp. GD03876]
MKNIDAMRGRVLSTRRAIGLAAKLVMASLAGSALTAGAATLNVDAQSATREISLEYYADTGLLKKRVDQPNGGQSQKLVTEYEYKKGNPTLESRTGWAGPVGQQTRKSGTAWSADDRFPSERSNGVWTQPEKVTFDPAFGGMTMRVDPNGWVTRWEYDGLGRKTVERRGYASETATTYTDYTQWTYEACTAGCTTPGSQEAVLIVTATIRSSAGAQIGPVVKSYVDRLNREIRSETQGLDGTGQVAAIYKDTLHDRRGQVTMVSQPYFATATPSRNWTYIDTDDLGRVSRETTPNNAITDVSYDGRETTTRQTVRGVERLRKSVSDGRGRPVSTTDARGNSSGFIYDAQGSMGRVLGPYGDVMSVAYDALGRKTSQNDPDLGDWSYGYNAFGEVISQTNALNKTSKMTYDALGRLVLREDNDLSTTFVYDTATSGLGRLAKVYSDNGYCREHGYDGLGRPTTTLMKLGSSACGNGTESLGGRVDYDASGRVATQTFPTGFTVTRGYHDTLGILTSLSSAQLGGTVLWSKTGGEPGGQPTAFSYGNGVATKVDYVGTGMGWVSGISAGPSNAVQFSQYARDEIGQVVRRDDSFDVPVGLSEWTEVDELGRLKAYYRKSLVDQTVVPGSRITVGYDAVGRIVSKSDVGTYYYAQPNGQRPHAVTAVRGAANVDYEYDAIGQMKVRNFADYLYTDAGFLRMAGATRKCHEFLYQGEGLRVQQTIFDSNCRQGNGQPQNGSYPVARTLYMHPDASNGLSFERETKGGATQYKHYVEADGRPIVEVVSTSGSVGVGTPVTLNYFHYDHLGSVVAVTNAGGGVVERRSFDPWGRVRQTNGTATANGDLPSGMNAATDRGFTLHEHLEGLDLIHMNGRAFDPLLARFTSGDPKIADPLDAQSYDRYAYVSNKPLDASDPTGYQASYAFSWGAAGGGDSMLRSIGAYIGINFSFGGGQGAAASSGNGQTTVAVGGGQAAGPSAYPKAMESNGEQSARAPKTGTKEWYYAAAADFEESAIQYRRDHPILDMFTNNSAIQFQNAEDSRLMGDLADGTLSKQSQAHIGIAVLSMLAGRAVAGANRGGPVVAYEVGVYRDLKRRSKPGDGLDVHHVGQAHAAQQVIPNYDRQNAPAITLPEREHGQIPNIKGIFTAATAQERRSFLANDIRNLRNYTAAPNSSLQKLIELNKSMYPMSFAKPPKE